MKGGTCAKTMCVRVYAKHFFFFFFRKMQQLSVLGKHKRDEDPHKHIQMMFIDCIQAFQHTKSECFMKIMSSLRDGANPNEFWVKWPIHPWKAKIPVLWFLSQAKWSFDKDATFDDFVMLGCLLVDAGAQVPLKHLQKALDLDIYTETSKQVVFLRKMEQHALLRKTAALTASRILHKGELLPVGIPTLIQTFLLGDTRHCCRKAKSNVGVRSSVAVAHAK